MTFEDNGAILPDTTFEHIRSVYEFDRELRLWLWRMIERVELKVRTQFAYVLSTSFGPDAYMKPSYFRDAEAHKQSLKSIQKEIDRGRRQGMPCILHNLNKYGELPLWAAVEAMSIVRSLLFTAILFPISKSRDAKSLLSKRFPLRLALAQVF